MPQAVAEEVRVRVAFVDQVGKLILPAVGFCFGAADPQHGAENRQQRV